MKIIWLKLDAGIYRTSSIQARNLSKTAMTSDPVKAGL